MSDSIEDIISELEWEFIGESSLRYAVRTSDGEIVRIDGAVWKASPFLRNHSAEGTSHLLLNASKSTVMDLLNAHRSGIFPSDLSSLLKLSSLIRYLMLQELHSKCLDTLFRMKNFTEKEYPQECCPETVMYCFHLLLEGPLRTAGIYKQQLARIAKHCSNDRNVMTNAVNLVKQKLEKFVGMDAIPVNFDRRTVPIVIFDRAGKLQTAIINENQLVTVNLFGKNFELESENVQEFYLKYASYLLFKSDSCVYRKSLQDADDPTEVLQGCNLFLTRANFVFAVVMKDETHQLLLWIDDEKFVKIYQTSLGIAMFDFEYENRLLAIGLCDGSFLLFRLQNTTLTLLQEKYAPGEDKNGITKQAMLIIFMRFYFQDYIKYGRFYLGRAEVAGIPRLSEKKHLENMRFVGGSCFYRRAGALQISNPSPEAYSPRAILARGECRALSELWMSL